MTDKTQETTELIFAIEVVCVRTADGQIHYGTEKVERDGKPVRVPSEQEAVAAFDSKSKELTGSINNREIAERTAEMTAGLVMRRMAVMAAAQMGVSTGLVTAGGQEIRKTGVPAEEGTHQPPILVK